MKHLNTLIALLFCSSIANAQSLLPFNTKKKIDQKISMANEKQLEPERFKVLELQNQIIEKSGQENLGSSDSTQIRTWQVELRKAQIALQKKISSLYSKGLLFPTWHKDYKTEFHDDTVHFLNRVNMTYSDSLNNIALYNEIAADYVGPFRMSVGMTLGYPKTDTNAIEQKKINREQFLQKFASGGGAVTLNFDMPILRTPWTGFQLMWSAGLRGTLEPPSFGASDNNFALGGGIGTDLQVSIPSIKGIFEIILVGRASYLAGNSGYYDMLSLTGSDRKGFSFNSYTLGLKVKDKFSLTYNGFGGSNQVKDRVPNYLSFHVDGVFE
jgi:hypothetical protein